MTEEDMGRMSAHVEAIRDDISQLKVGYSKLIELMGKLTHIEDRFKSNDESHRIIWDKMNKNTDELSNRKPAIDTILTWKRSINKLWYSLAAIGIVEVVRTYIYIKGAR